MLRVRTSAYLLGNTICLCPFRLLQQNPVDIQSGLYTREIYFSQFWRLEAQDQGVSRSGI